MTTTSQAAPAGLAERERVLCLLRAHEPELRERGITRLGLFGSVARGDAGPESDVDLLIEVAPEKRFSLFDLVDLQDELGAMLGRPVQLAFGSNMRPWLRAWIEDDRIEIF